MATPLQLAAPRSSLGLAIGILVAIGLGTWGFQQLVSTTQPGSRGSTYSRNTHGAASLFRLAEALGETPQRQRTRWIDPPGEEVAQIWLLAPATPPTPDEIETLEHWIAGGGTLVLVDQRSQFASPWEPWLGGAIVLRDAVPNSALDKIRPASETLGEVGAPSRPGAQLMSLEVLPAQSGHPLTQGIPPLLVLPSKAGSDWEVAVLQLPANPTGSSFTPLWSTAAGPVLAERVLGNGRLVVCTQPILFGNALLARPGYTELAAALLRYRTRPGAIAFSEYHHGYTERLRGVGDLLAVGWGRAFLWGGVVLVLAMISMSWRFVAIPEAPLPLPPDPSEYAAALGGLYRRAGVVENIHYNLAVFYRRIAHEGLSAHRSDRVTLAGQRRAERLAKRLGEHEPGPHSARALLRLLASERAGDPPAS